MRKSPILSLAAVLGIAAGFVALGRWIDRRRRLRRPLRDYDMLLADRPARVRALTTPRR